MNIRSAVSLLAVAALFTGFAEHAAAQASVEAEVATGVVDRMPDGSGSQFPLGVGELFVWTRVTGAGGTSIEHVWMHDGNEYPVSLAVGSSPWRTWSSKVIPPEWAGEWTVEIRVRRRHGAGDRELHGRVRTSPTASYDGSSGSAGALLPGVEARADDSGRPVDVD